MDQIIAKASNQAVSFAIRSGISIASGYAIRTVTKFLEQLPESEKKRIEVTRNKIQTKINIVSISIDLIKLAAARGNSILEATVEFIDELQQEFDAFDETVDKISKQLTNGNEKESVKKVEEYMKGLLSHLNEAIPILNLSLISSGVNMKGSITTNSISPGRLLQAANYINIATTDNQLEQVGPTFDMVMYSIFYNPSRMKYIEKESLDELSLISWKETFARCSVKITKGKDNYAYNLDILEDFNDTRYHDEDESKPQLKSYDSLTISRMFFSASGKLLRLESRNSPVLIIKLVDDKTGAEEWIALGELHKGEFDDDDDDEDDEEAVGNETLTKEIRNSSLSILEYLIRLCKIQQIEQKSILEVPDELLALYLKDAVNAPTNTIIEPKSHASELRHDINSSKTNNVITMDSNINRLQNLDLDK
ncbi:Ran-specific GTPase-activating protein 30 (Ran binding protein 30) (RANBP30) [Scheffersomyces stipitis CBS 6054]|uniref:Ran-specific GTPase-activating protein 30 (Ran binding protein 30) (RANBP30) n=1 Tax=Scheffersomyces stipitis (strain ATCC 58785 / CBS 6054 / NBRC 10063 / NRRL Y-11545) TaxID=322104 RepID=A3GI50_PICST|nr:Ran-specific GTPase-activating protein 30 (Ran binding protein 30) (RANBP30) [Scheffersomyces stipitis CBS 6054]EAZ63172.2 Ran-specific GTPase-activating protein 30 (Ran binding protein 30) (RANBP30) [Scheffersomyces stipitis CBS 6054]